MIESCGGLRAEAVPGGVVALLQARVAAVGEVHARWRRRGLCRRSLASRRSAKSVDGARRRPSRRWRNSRGEALSPRSAGSTLRSATTSLTRRCAT